MKNLLKNIYTGILLMAMLFVSSCKSDEPTAQPESTTPHTLIYYFAGTSLSIHFFNNISAAETSIRKGEKKDGRVICFFQSGNKNKAEIIELIYNNGSCERKVLASYDIPTTMDAEQLTFYLNKIIKLAPAESYGIVMAGHGTGWVPINAEAQSSSAVAQHKTGGQRPLTHEELWKKQETGVETRFFGEKYTPTGSHAFDIPELAKGFAGTGIYFDYILFDACLMANVESVYDLRKNARYIIASPCEIMAAGFPYADIVPLLMKDGGRSHDLAGVCKVFNEHYKNHTSYRSGSVALVDCAQLDALAAKVKAINNGKTKSYNISQIQSFEGQKDHVFFDIGDYMNQMCDDEQALKAFEQQLKLTIPTKYTLSVFWSNYGIAGEYPIRTFSGLTTSAPSVLYQNDYKETAWYKATH